MLPDTPPTAPVPIAQSYQSGAGTGTITFDQPLDQTVTLDPADWFRGIGSFRRPVTALSYSSATVVAITGMSSNEAVALANGWAYTPGAAPIKGTNGLNVAGFTAFLG